MKYGNLCIAGHNYKNDTFFSKISKLEIGDNIKIYDNFMVCLEYEVINVSKTNQNDLSCTSQETNGLKMITLVTCDNFDDNSRIIVVAKEKIL